MVAFLDIFRTSYVPVDEAMLRLALAALLGFVAGLEREIKDKPIGFRPYTLVSLGAASFTLIVMELATRLGQDQGTEIDPTRVMQGIIGGIGFLGAGALFRAGDEVRGASTGAGIWVFGGVGMACGFGFYGLATIVAALTLFVLLGGGLLRGYVRRRADSTPASSGPADAQSRTSTGPTQGRGEA